MNRLINAFFFSLAGIRAAFRDEAAFRLEIYLSCIMLPALIFLPVPLILKWVIGAAHLLVMITELLNSAIEATVDLVSPEKHPLAKKAKDTGSAAVLLTLIPTTLLWGYAACLTIRYCLI